MAKNNKDSNQLSLFDVNEEHQPGKDLVERIKEENADERLLGKNYGVKWNWLYNHFNGREAENCLYGSKNIDVHHDVLVRLHGPSYVVSLFNGTAIQKRPNEISDEISYDSVEELIAKLIFIGRISLKAKYETILDYAKEGLSSVPDELKDEIVRSFEEPYLPSNREVPD